MKSAIFVDAETGKRVTVAQKDIEHVDAASVAARYGAVIVLKRGETIHVQETPTEVRGRFRYSAVATLKTR